MNLSLFMSLILDARPIIRGLVCTRHTTLMRPSRGVNTDVDDLDDPLNDLEARMADFALQGQCTSCLNYTRARLIMHDRLHSYTACA